MPHKKTIQDHSLYVTPQILSLHTTSVKWIDIPWGNSPMWSVSTHRDGALTFQRQSSASFPRPPTSKETASYRSRHASRHVRDARAVMHVGIAYLRWRGKRSRHSRHMRTRNFCVSGKKPMDIDFPLPGIYFAACKISNSEAWYYQHGNEMTLNTSGNAMSHWTSIHRVALVSQSTILAELSNHYIDVMMTTMASQITSLTVVYSTVYSDADHRKHQSSASLAFVRGIHRDRWIPRRKGQLHGKCFHLMTSSCITIRAGTFLHMGSIRWYPTLVGRMQHGYSLWIRWLHHLGIAQGLYSLSCKTSYRQISWNLEATRLGVIIITALWNLTGISAALLPRCLSNFKAIGKV